MKISTYVAPKEKIDNAQARLTWFSPKDTATDAGTIGFLSVDGIPNFNTEFDPKDLIRTNETAYMTAMGMSGNLRTMVECINSVLYTQGYFSQFVLSNMQTTMSEAYAPLALIGDNYGAVFTGSNPQTMGISGRLVLDFANNPDALSWFHAFVLAYEFFMRGSVLATIGFRVKLTLPDVGEYEGYITSFTYQMDGMSDVFIPFSMTMFLVNPGTNYPSEVRLPVDMPGSARIALGNVSELGKETLTQNSTLGITQWTPPGTEGKTIADFNPSLCPSIPSSSTLQPTFVKEGDRAVFEPLKVSSRPMEAKAQLT